MTATDEIEQSLFVLRREIRRLDAIGLRFAASLVRIAEVELQVRLHNVSDEDIDQLSLATIGVERDCNATKTKN
jgi:hypothetical protein